MQDLQMNEMQGHLHQNVIFKKQCHVLFFLFVVQFCANLCPTTQTDISDGR